MRSDVFPSQHKIHIRKSCFIVHELHDVVQKQVMSACSWSTTYVTRGDSLKQGTSHSDATFPRKTTSRPILNTCKKPEAVSKCRWFTTTTSPFHGQMNNCPRPFFSHLFTSWSSLCEQKQKTRTRKQNTTLSQASGLISMFKKIVRSHTCSYKSSTPKQISDFVVESSIQTSLAVKGLQAPCKCHHLCNWILTFFFT